MESFTPQDVPAIMKKSRNGWLLDYNDANICSDLMYSTNGNNDRSRNYNNWIMML